MTLPPEHVMRILLDRLNWPIRFARWQAARQFASLLSSTGRETAVQVLLDWLQSRRFETEVVGGLTVLMCADFGFLPPAKDVRAAIRKPSILAELLFQRLYGAPLGGYLQGHSGPAPGGFPPKKYFEEHIGRVIPPILAADFQRLESETGFPFHAQWAFEWRTLMDNTGSPYSSYPYHFMHKVNSREGVGIQVSQGQCNVFRSAFLRTLAYAVEQRIIPLGTAVLTSARCLPLSAGVLSINPMARPAWLRDIPEECCRAEAPLEELARQLVGARDGVAVRPVSMRIPIGVASAEFGELRIEGFYATNDFIPNSDFADDHTQPLRWPIYDLLSIEGELPRSHIEDFRIHGIAGSCLPVCLDVFPTDFGFWQNDYMHLGLAFPAPYSFDSPLSVDFAKGWGNFSANGAAVGTWKTWNDNWSPVYPLDGHTRCGAVTEVGALSLETTATELGMGLAWQVTLRLWEKSSDYGEPRLTTRSCFFRH